MYKLYDVVFTDKTDRKELYFKGDAKLTENGLSIAKGRQVDLLTYFNCFSITKWKQYTTIRELQLSGTIDGDAEIEVYSIGKGGRVLAKHRVNGDFTLLFTVQELKGEILGVRIYAYSNCILQQFEYSATFEHWRNLKIGVAICTFKREEYVKATIGKLSAFSNTHPWLTTLVVDNGMTLVPCATSTLRIVHNPNYGGSGGFTRGLIENLVNKTNDYVLLMDDDIDLETSALKHMYGLLSGLKDEYKESFMSGAMLRMQTPCIQHENTAYWGKIRLHSLGQGWNLVNQQTLLDNEAISDYENQYGAWWYCCIPLKRVEEIGLPLPVFVKGDDIEYGLRNNRKIIHMNGIGVWHEAFEGKQALWVNFFCDRNFLIMNHYAKGCNRLTFITAIIGRLVKRSCKLNSKEINMLSIAIKDVMCGFEAITEMPADAKLQKIRAYKCEGSTALSVIHIFSSAIKYFFLYSELNKKYIAFRTTKLSNANFWEEYLKKSKVELNDKRIV